MALHDRLSEWRQDIEGDYIAPIEAQRFVDYMLENYSNELYEWMLTRTVQFVTQEMTLMDRRHRARMVRRAAAKAFSEAETTEDLGVFRLTFTIDPDLTRRPLGLMTGGDCRFVAAGYRADGNHSLAMAAFLEALGKRAGGLTVAEVIDERTCGRLLASFLPAGELPTAA